MPKLSSLPLFILNRYTFHHLNLQDTEAILAEKLSEEVSPTQIDKDLQLLKKHFDLPIAFLFNNLSTYQRNKLLELRVPFVVPDKQLYFPFIALDLTETKEAMKKERSILRPASQCLLLFHLQVERLSNQNFQHIASRLPYSPMTISRIAQELADLGLASIVGKKDRYLIFDERHSTLWEKAQNFLSSPIKTDCYVNKLPENYHLYTTFDSALSHFSDLSPGKQLAFAMSPDDFQHFKSSHAEEINYFEGEIRLEHWAYPPGALTYNNVVDPISLYLSMKGINNERVEMALEQLILKIKEKW
jgi:hypothetical protein